MTDLWGNSNAASMNTAISDDDAAAPTISSTQYKVSTGVLSLTLSEDLAAHDSTKITLYDSTKSGNVTFAANTFSESSAGVLSVTLSGDKKSGFEDLNHPRSVAILVGGVTDIWGNSNTANMTSTISDDDDAAPTISSTKYMVSTGVLSLTMSEDLASHDSAKITLYDSTKSGNVTFAANAFSESSAGVLSVTLSGDKKSGFEDLNHPRSVAILVGGVTDIWGNSNTANMTSTISGNDGTTPTISSTKYKVSTGVLNVTLSEDLASHDSTKVVLYDSTKSGNVTFAANAFSEVEAGILSITLSGSKKSGFEDLNHPRNVAILVGGVTDLWGNSNAASMNTAISDDDTAAPTISSTQYKVSTGVLSLTMSEDLAAHDSTKIVLYDSTKSGNVTFAANAFSEVADGILSVTLSGSKKSGFEDLNHPRNVAILVGGVTDLWGNSNAASMNTAISDDDTAAPTISSTQYKVSTGVLSLTMSEDLASHDSAKITLYDSTKSGNVTFAANAFSESSAGVLSVTLNGDPKSDFEDLNHPRNVAILVGGVTDIWGNSNTANMTSTISDDDTAAPTISSTKYKVSTGVLNVTLSEDLASHDSAKITLYDSTKSGNVTFAANAFSEVADGILSVTLSGDKKSGFEDLNHPRNVAILVGGVTDIWGNSNAASMNAAISDDDDAAPTISSVKYDVSAGVLNVTLSEDLASHDSAKITLYDSTKSGNVTFAANAFSEVADGILSVTLSGDKKSGFEDLNHPRNVAILVGGVTDIWGNSNAASMNAAISDDDAAAPTISSTKYKVSTGVLNVTLSEDLASHDSAKIVLYDSTKSGNVTFAADTFSESSAGVLSVTLSGSKKSGFEDLNHPRNVAILVGGVTDIWGNSNAASMNAAISDDDVAAPAVSSATYDTSSGLLRLTFTEDLAFYNSSRITLHDSTNLGNVTLGSGSFSEAPPGTLTATLAGSDRSAFESLTSPRSVAVLPGGTVDIWGNANASPLSSTVSGDTVPPRLTAATYYTGNSTVLLEFSESLGSHDSTKIILSDLGNSANITFAAGRFSGSGQSIAAVLDGNQGRSLEGMSAPVYALVLPGGVVDSWDNANSALLKESVAVLDTAPPTLSSATYTTSGTITMSFSEALGQTATGNFSLQTDAYSAQFFKVSVSKDEVTAALDAADAPWFDRPGITLGIGAGAVTDTAGNPIAAHSTKSITVVDNLSPVFVNGTYHTNGTLALQFNEGIKSVNPSGIQLRDDSAELKLSGAPSILGSMAIFTLNKQDSALFNDASYVILGIVTGAVTDLAGNSNEVLSGRYLQAYDNVKPHIASATYYAADGILSMKMSEPVARAQPSMMTLNTTGATATLSGSAKMAGDIISVTLSAQDRTRFASSSSMSVSMSAGAVTDAAGNQIDEVSYYSVTVSSQNQMDLVGGSYSNGDGTIHLVFSENVTGVDYGQITMQSSSYTYTLPGGSGSSVRSHATAPTAGQLLQAAGLQSAGQTDGNVLEVILEEEPRARFAQETAINLSIGSNAVNGTANQIDDTTTSLVVSDTVKPSFVSAAYRTDTGVLSMTFDEIVGSVDSGGLTLRGGGAVVKPSFAPAKSGHTASVQMSGAEKASLADASGITLDIDAGAVKDVSGNPIVAASSLPVTISSATSGAQPPAIISLLPLLPLPLPLPAPPPPPAGPLTVTFNGAPAPASASYDAAGGLLSVTFTEAIDPGRVEADRFNLTESGSPLEMDRFSQNGSRTITATVKGVQEYGNMTLRLDADAVSDLSGKGNLPSSVAVRVYDPAGPAPSHATYNRTLGQVSVHFDADIADVEPALFRIGNHTLQDVTRGHTLLERVAHFAVDPEHQGVAESYRTLDAGAGGAAGLNGTLSPPAYGMPIYGTPDAGDVESAVYDAVSGTLWLEIYGYQTSLDGSAVTLGDSPLSEMRVVLNGVPIYEESGAAVPEGGLLLNVGEGAIATAHGAIPAGAYDVERFEGVLVREVSETEMGNSTAVQIVRNPSNGTVYAALASSHNVSMVDITEPAAPAAGATITADGPVLDMDVVEMPGAAYLAVLTNKSVTLYDAAEPSKAAGRLLHPSGITQGAVSYVMLDGLGHLVVASQEGAASILVAEPSSPVVLARASLNGEAAPRIGSAGIAEGVAAASLLSGQMCLLYVNGTNGLAAGCDVYGGGDPVAVSRGMAGEGPTIIVAGDAPVLSAHDVHLNVTAYRDDVAGISDVETAQIWGKTYAVALASGQITVYDAEDDLARVSSAPAAHTLLDVAEFAGSVYAVLAGQNMTIVELAGTQ